MGLAGKVIVNEEQKDIFIDEDSLHNELFICKKSTKAKNIVLVISINWGYDLFLAGKLEISEEKTTISGVDVYEYFKKYEGKNCNIVIYDIDSE